MSAIEPMKYFQKATFPNSRYAQTICGCDMKNKHEQKMENTKEFRD